VTRGKVPGQTQAEFQRLAEDAKANCIISKALTVPMKLQATLLG
jgi:organic hydroperoxide reductase OsmC/OhrA